MVRKQNKSHSHRWETPVEMAQPGKETPQRISLLGKEQKVDRKKVALETLARYSGTPVRNFQKYILLTNFPHYVDAFSEIHQVKSVIGPVLKVAHCRKAKISIIDYRVGAPMAALIIDALSYINPQCVLMLGLCGGLHRNQKVGDYLLPMAAIRDEGASRHYMPLEVPSLPAFMVQQFISQELLTRNINFRTGVIHTTDYRMWEFDKAFRERLRLEKATAIDMESSAIFTTAFCRKVSAGALMLISDLPIHQTAKTAALAESVFASYTQQHLELGVGAFQRIQTAIKEKRINFRRFHFDSI